MSYKAQMTNLPLQKQVAELLGWTDLEERKDGSTGRIQLVGVKPGTMPSKFTDYKPQVIVPDYPNDMNAAWEVAEAVKIIPIANADEFTKDFSVTLQIKYQYNGTWFVCWQGGPSAEAESAPLAICKAFLSAKESEHERR